MGKTLTGFLRNNFLTATDNKSYKL